MTSPANAPLGQQMSQTSAPLTNLLPSCHQQQSQFVATPLITTNVPVSTSVSPANGTVLQTQVQPRIRTVQETATTSREDQGRWWSSKKKAAASGYRDPWYSKAAEEYPAGYPSLAAYMSDDIDGRVYRRFSYLRNRLLLHMQDKLNELEQDLEDVDRNDEEKAINGEAEALFRLISRRYNEQTATPDSSAGSQKCACCCRKQPGNSAANQENAPGTQQSTPGTNQQSIPGTNQQSTPGATQQSTDGASTVYPFQHKNNATKRMEILKNVEETLEKYDELLLREHEISSVRESTTKQRASLANFIWNGKPCGPGKNKKPLASQENKLIYRKDDSILLGTQEDAWLGTAAESMKRLMPSPLRRYLLATREDREKSKSSKTEYLSNERVNSFVKAVVCVASTILLVLPIIILYALSTNGASGWLKIGILLVFVVAFALALSILTNASRSEMFGGSAGYTAVLIVFLTFTGS